MNYIRGAVNAISAPYQYYRDLPPINPSTLTGAIDVIVIQRPTDNGASELACSPFHVRFGKWQVLRPGEKQVNVFVNGNPIPFSMKIGEAGEAFFVFETDDDVPPDLITSPIIQPTDPSADDEQDPVRPDRFGAKQDDDDDDNELNAAAFEEERIRVEPDFLDLDGGAEDVHTTPKQAFHVPKKVSSSTLSVPPPRERSHTPEMDEQDERVDAALQALKGQVHIPQVEYHHDIAIDMDGYKQETHHDRERSDQTVRSASHSQQESPTRPTRPSPLHPHVQSSINSPHVASPSPSPPPPRHLHAPHNFRATSEPPPDMEAEDTSGLVLSIPSHSIPSPGAMQEYSWEWGAFPQPSPMKPSFGKGGRLEPPSRKSTSGWKNGKNGRLAGMRLPPATATHSQSTEQPTQPQAGGRSRSVPPQMGGSPKKGRREYREYEDADETEEEEDEDEERGRRSWASQRSKRPLLTPAVETPEEDSLQVSKTFGFGGTLSTSKDDPTLLVLSIEGRKVAFQLSLTEDEDTDAVVGQRHTLAHGIHSSSRTIDEVETVRLFDRYLVQLDRFLDDESVVEDPRLVIRWGGEQYITRKDGSPLMDALVHWRTSTLALRASGDAIRPVSPPPTEDQIVGLPEPQFDLAEPVEHKAQVHARSKSEPPSDAEMRRAEEEDKKADRDAAAAGVQANRKPTSSSWVQWWSRSRKNDTSSTTNGHALSDSSKEKSAISLPMASRPRVLDETKKSASADVVNGSGRPASMHLSADDAAFPPVHEKKHDRPSKLPPTPTKKFAKTLRLTSDQLKSLNLRPGANSITFSLSTSGAVAATARIFVWDSTDLVVVSDIDGTITKSDGLGHVFAMIGRDWTHVGVAKLYTDIVRNGYKIMYLTSRAIGQADATRDYLKGIKQNNYQLPEGPVIMSPDRLMASLHREVIMRKPEVFKMACLRDIQRLFGESARNQFYAGFGNRITDALSYRSVNVPSARIFTIDSAGEVKMELLELAGYKSSYIHMTDLVDQMFPPIHRKWTPEFTDFNYWKTPVQDFALPDFSPPSPTLSARSDTSNQSTLARLRNFSLGGGGGGNGGNNNNNRQHVNKQSSITSIPDVGEDEEAESAADAYRSSHLRQMSSFEKLSSTLGFMRRANGADAMVIRRSASPSSASASSSYWESDDEDEDGAPLDEDGKRRKRQRRRSMTSMPGTLDETHYGMDDDEHEHDYVEGDDGYGYDDGNGEGDERAAEEEAEEAFDDDLLAAGEMQKVPFL